MKMTFIGCGDAFATGGRNQTCFLVEDNGTNFLIDCGPVSISGLKKNKFNILDLDFIILTHFHGDHFGGLPFFLMDFDYNLNRKKELTIYGPRKVKERVQTLCDVMFPGYDVEKTRFPLKFKELMPDAKEKVHGKYDVNTYLMEHEAYSDCLGYKISNGKKSIAYTGDTAWTEKLYDLSDETDLFICECSIEDKHDQIRHISFDQLKINSHKFNTKKLILTHLSLPMIDKINKIKYDVAYENLEVNL